VTFVNELVQVGFEITREREVNTGKSLQLSPSPTLFKIEISFWTNKHKINKKPPKNKN
jgi:hypothetical protein